MSENPIPVRAEDLASRIAQQTLARRGADYADEVRRLLDAALNVIREYGTSSRPRVADIVAAAGLSNDAFYRHFPSRDALVTALLEDGTERLAGYLRHQMDKEASPEEQVRRWVEGVLSQTKREIAAPTLAVLWNGGSVGTNRPHDASTALASLLHEPFAALGCTDPELFASLVSHATLGKVAEYLWAERTPTRSEVAQIVAFSVAVARR
jgi:AcrR family transcriptional regulator